MHSKLTLRRNELKAQSLFLNAIATDNRLDERRSKITQYWKEAWQSAEREIGKDPKKDFSSQLLSEIVEKRFITSSSKTTGVIPGNPALSIDLIGPQNTATYNKLIGHDEIEDVVCVSKTVSALRHWKGARYGWSDSATLLDPFADGLLEKEVDRRWSEIIDSDCAWVEFPKSFEFAYENRLTWITPKSTLRQLADLVDRRNIATRYRDFVGLGDWGSGQHIVSLEINADLLKDQNIYRPRFCDQADYIWFMVGSTANTAPPVPVKFGQTCCLKKLADGVSEIDGAKELVVLGLKSDCLKGQRLPLNYLGMLKDYKGADTNLMTKKIEISKITVFNNLRD